MFLNKDKMYQIYHTILCMALTWALILSINQYYGLKVHVLIGAVFSFVPAALVYLFDCNRKNTISYLILFCIIPVAGLIFWIMKTNPITWVSRIYHWCLKYNGTKELYVASNAHFVLLGAALAGTVLFYLLIKNQIAKEILAVCTFAVLVLLCIFKINTGKIVVCICIFYILSILVELCGRVYSRKSGQPEKKAGILYLAPICLVLAIISVSMPSKPQPIKWEGVKALYKKAKDRIDYLITEMEFFNGKGSDEFGMSMTGYSENGGKLNNNKIAKNNKIALVIDGYRGNAPIYLIGSVSDIYTGKSWEKSKTDNILGQDEYTLDYDELVFAMSRVDREVIENNRFVDRKVIKISYDNIKTKTFFYPGKSSWFELLGKRKKIKTEFANINFERAAGKGTYYNNIYYEINLNGIEFQKMLKGADAFSYDNNTVLNQDNIQWIESKVFYSDSTTSMLKKPDIIEVLSKRADIIKDKYTALPQTLPERVHELASQITANAVTTYDKLKAIEEYLKTYTYDTAPGKVPDNMDFVDNFLFESKKGYCTSFATSFAVLARCAGIPARYVEGYVVDYSEGGSNQFNVRNSNAHSWAEAYIEGVGWIPFEATPPYYEYRYVAWKEYDKNNNTRKADYSPVPEQYAKQFQKNQEMIKLKKKENTKSAIIGGIILLSTALILLIIFITYYMILKYKYRKAFEKADYGRKMYLLFLRILAMLSRENYILEPQETILMLADRVKDKYNYNEATFMQVAEVFMRYRYAQAEITEWEFNKVNIYYKGLEDKVKEETGRLKLHLLEFLFLAKKSSR